MPLPLRALPRTFLPLDLPQDPDPAIIPLPTEEFKKIHDVLRLRSGDHIALLPGDGRVLRCELAGRQARVLESHTPPTEATLRLTLALALPKPDALEESVRLATEIGAHAFVLFESRRSVVKWDEAKFEKKLARLRAIAREAAEVAFRTLLPEITVQSGGLTAVLQTHPEALVLSESDSVPTPLPDFSAQTQATLVIGPEGGWDKPEQDLIGPRARTLGPRVLRVATAVAAATTLALAPNPNP